MLKVLEMFHHHINQRIIGKMERHIGAEELEFLPVVEVLETEVLWPMQE